MSDRVLVWVMVLVTSLAVMGIGFRIAQIGCGLYYGCPEAGAWVCCDDSLTHVHRGR